MEDKTIRWARPAIIWLGLVFIALTDIILPTASALLNLDLPKLTIDPNFWDAWSIAVSIYVGGRSLEKIGFPTTKKAAPSTEAKVEGGSEKG